MVADATAPTLVGSTNARPGLLKRASMFGTSKRFQNAEAQQLISFFCIVLTIVVDFMGLNIQNPLMPFYVAEFEDARDMGVGTATSVLVASYALSQFLSTPIFGFGSDRFGRRKFLMLSMLGSCLGFLGQAFCKSLVSLCVMRFVTGLFGGSRPVAIAYIGDAIPPEQQPKYVSGITLGVSLSLFIGPVLGGSMGMVNLALPCYFQSACALVALIMNYLYLKDPPKRAAKSAPAGGAAGQPGAQRPYKGWLVANALVGGCIMFAIGGWTTIFPIHAESRLGMDQNRIGLTFGVAGLALGLSQFLVYVPLSKYVNIKVISCLGLPLIGVLVFVPFGPQEVWFLLMLVFLQGFGIALSMPGVSMTVNLLAPGHVRGGLIALTMMWQSLMRVLGPLVLGPLYDANIKYPFYVILGAVCFAWILELALTQRVPRLRKGPAAAPTKDEALTDAPAPTADDERESILQNLHEVHDQLTLALEHIRTRKAGLLEGRSREELGMHAEGAVPPKPTVAQKKDLGDWFVDMLLEHNYKRWPEHIDVIKSICRNAFPKVRGTGFLNRFEEIEHILESHLMLEQQWEQFVLQKSLGEFSGTADFDWSAISELANRSSAPSEDAGTLLSGKPQEQRSDESEKFVGEDV
eukprot:TRINITY_DN19340_c0_g1_i1.p1 TRINITY_DN19340_c0_g1~~TRINITY_DN19340_c0_g1_i1.p1  ORF type:complete len:635 (-),score=122.12 TRINITY_DN19340_c0_g1_i1:357-2261(-)